MFRSAIKTQTGGVSSAINTVWGNLQKPHLGTTGFSDFKGPLSIAEWKRVQTEAFPGFFQKDQEQQETRPFHQE